MSRIHYFNPGHETAVLLGTQNYTAPTNVRKMQKDLALLPVWYAEEDDFVYLETIPPQLLRNAKIMKSRTQDKNIPTFYREAMLIVTNTFRM